MVVLDIDAGHYHSLDAIAATAWRLADGTRTVEQMARASGHPVDALALALTDLVDLGLIEQPSTPRIDRRSLIARLTAAGIAAPVIASITIASPAAADSTCGKALGAMCLAGCCVEPLTCCSAQCWDLQNDPNNCGSCGNVCPNDENTFSTCTGGFCNTICLNNYGDCSGDGHCETDLDSDPDHCGDCFTRCTGGSNVATWGCDAGVCAIWACESEYGNCNGDPDDGCEVYLTTDPNNCGECGIVCDLPNADYSCQGGFCHVDQCHTGFRDCNDDPTDGCEIDITSDPNNCGACYNTCFVDHGTAVCVNGFCEIDTCDDGYVDCLSGTCEDWTNNATCGSTCQDCGADSVCFAGGGEPMCVPN